MVLFTIDDVKESDILEMQDTLREIKINHSYECFLLGIHTVRKVCGGYQPATAGF